MRHFSPSPIPRETEKWLYDALTRLQAQAGQSSAGLSAVIRGEVPDGSGNPLTPDLSQYFYLPGRNGGQIAHGDTAASGTLTLSSTKSETKGLIYLGTARGSAFDELNNRLGLKTTTPSAVLHVVGEAPSSLFWRPSSNTFNAGFAQGGTPAPPAGLAEVVPDDFTSYIATVGSNPIGDIALKLNGVFAGTTPLPAPTSNWVLRWKCCLLIDPGIAPVTYSWSILDENGGVVVSGTLEPSLKFVAGSPNTFPVARTVNLTLGQATALATANGLGTTLSVGFHMDTFVGLGASSSTNTWFLTWMELEVPGGTGTGLGQETAIFQVASGQIANNTEWQSSAGTPLVDVTAAGRLTIESGGSFRHVPGAAASTLFKGDASGDASWGTITLLSAYHSDTVAGTVVLGDMIVGNATPKWDKLAGNITTTRKFLRQTGTGSVSALPVWDTLVAGDIPALSSAAGWTDDGTVVRLTTSTDRVGIGTASVTTDVLSVLNVNATTDVILKITGKASQTGDSLRIADSGNVSRFQVSAPTTETLVKLSSPTSGRTRLRFEPNGTNQMYIDFGQTGDFGPALGTNTGLPGPGTRFNTYWDPSNPSLCDGYGQDGDDAWVLVDVATNYTIWTADSTSASRMRARWAANGNLENFGPVRSSKFTVGTTGLSAGVPGIVLEETGAGTDAIAIRAPAVVGTGTRIQTLQALTGVIPIVGDDPPAVATAALGKVDRTGESAAIASVNLSSSAPAGMYLVQYTLLVTTLDATAGTIQFQVNYTDTLGATNQAGAALVLTATGRQSGEFVVQLASGELSYQTNLVTVGGGAERYAIYVRVMFLG